MRNGKGGRELITDLPTRSKDRSPLCRTFTLNVRCHREVLRKDNSVNRKRTQMERYKTQDFVSTGVSCVFSLTSGHRRRNHPDPDRLSYPVSRNRLRRGRVGEEDLQVVRNVRRTRGSPYTRTVRTHSHRLSRVPTEDDSCRKDLLLTHDTGLTTD